MEKTPAKLAAIDSYFDDDEPTGEITALPPLSADRLTALGPGVRSRANDPSGLQTWVDVSSEGHIVGASPRFGPMVGLDWQPGSCLISVIDDEDQENVERLIKLVSNLSRQGTVEFSAYHAERGTQRFVAEVVPFRSDGATHVRLLLSNITERTQARRELEAVLPWLRAVTEDSREVTVIVGESIGEHLLSGSPSLVLGIPERSFSLARLRHGIHPADRGPALHAIDGVRTAPGARATTTFRMDDNHGSWLHVEAVATNRSTDPRVRGVVITFRDHTDRSVRDSLTGLPNRVLLLDRLDEVLRSESCEDYALLVLGLDRLHHVRGTLGAGAVDSLVRAFADRMRSLARDEWTVARTGEGELTLLALGLAPSDVRPLLARIGGLTQEPFLLAGQEVVSSLTIGVALSTRSYTSSRAMLHDAHAAYERAREKGTMGGQQVANTQVLDLKRDRVQLETELYRAIAEKEFRLQYQPIVALPGGALLGFEALIRWRHPQEGLISPARFLPVAEDSGQIVAIGQWVVERAVAQLARWRRYEAKAQDLIMSINVSARQLVNPGLVPTVEKALLDHGIPPELIKLEVTETSLIQNPETAAETLRRLRKLGCRVALDDFGTGYCSLAYLTRFPVDTLKIDREFVSGEEGVLTSERGAPLVRAIVDLARSLKLEVVAEGIETEEQAAAITELGCEVGQGWFFGRPVAPKAARALIKAE